MGTMCIIASKCKDGYRAISVHFDGYLEGAGALLVHNYNTETKVNKLIALGDLSSLGPTIGHQFDNNDDVMHSALSNIQCIAYHRDGGRQLHIFKSPTIRGLFDNYTYSCVDYGYVWDGGDWWYYRDAGHRRKVAEYKIVQSAIKEFDAQSVKDEATLIAENIVYYARVLGGIAATMIEEPIRKHESNLDKQSIKVMYDTLYQYIKDKLEVSDKEVD